MCLEHEQQEHKFRFKNTNPEIKIQKLKISKSPFSQTQQNHQILKPQSTKSIQKYNTTNPNKKNLKLRKTHLKQANPANPPQACTRSGQGGTHTSFCEDLCNLLEAKTTTTKLTKPVHIKSSMKSTKGNCEEKEKVEKNKPWRRDE